MPFWPDRGRGYKHDSRHAQEACVHGDKLRAVYGKPRAIWFSTPYAPGSEQTGPCRDLRGRRGRCNVERDMSSEKSVAGEPPRGRRRVVANLVLIAAWIYVAMIYLLALDQQFHWGIFGP